ncbi:OmpA family protein [Candidatus Poribacteria bacterium]|nr:OmpA family protein [Candidatus Poribacteria bacterium]
MNYKGTLTVSTLLLVGIVLLGCGKLSEKEFEMWKNEHVAQIDQTTDEIKMQVTKLESKVDQNDKNTSEAISKAKDEAIAASQQGDADTIAAASQNAKEEDAKLRANLTKDIEMQSKKSMDFAKAEDAKVQKMVSANTNSIKSQSDDIAKLKAQVATILADLGEVQAEVASQPSLLVTVNFGSGQTGLSNKAKQMLDGIVNQILENPEAQVIIVGHADGTPVLRGSHRSNWDLSQSRANSAAKYLKAKGIESDRIKSVGKAHTDPVASHTTAAGRAMNRRVEVILNPSGS